MKVALSCLSLALLALGALVAFRPAGSLVTSSTREIRPVPPFSRVLLATSATVIVRQGPQQVTIEASPEDLNRLETNVTAGQLRISTMAPTGWDRLSVRRRGSFTVRITLPIVSSLSVRSSGDMEVDSLSVKGLVLDVGGSGHLRVRELRASNVQAELSSSGRISIDHLRADTLQADVAGSGSITAAGSCTHSSLDLSSSGAINTDRLVTSTCLVHVSGSGNCQVNASRAANVRISSSGTVVLSGNPSINQRISGSGQLLRKSF